MTPGPGMEPSLWGYWAGSLAAGLGVIICVGETLEERDAGKAEEVVSRQVEGSVPASESAAVTALGPGIGITRNPS